VASLKTSLADLKNTNVKTNGISAVSDQLTKIQDNLKTVKSDAHGQFSTQINALSSALSTLGSSLTAAKDNLSGGTLTSVASATGTVVTAGNSLVSAVSSTC
jgi:capsule polysaccharide export protein KpsE/RkpR